MIANFTSTKQPWALTSRFRPAARPANVAMHWAPLPRAGHGAGPVVGLSESRGSRRQPLGSTGQIERPRLLVTWSGLCATRAQGRAREAQATPIRSSFEVRCGVEMNRIDVMVLR